MSIVRQPSRGRPNGSRTYANVPDRGSMLAVDLDREQLTAARRTGVRCMNIPMAVTPAGEQIVVGYRLFLLQPPQINLSSFTNYNAAVVTASEVKTAMRVSYLFDRTSVNPQAVLRRFSAVAILFCICASAVATPTVPTGLVHTPDVDVAYDVEGSDITRPPVVVVNGGPGLTHAYMEQNDLWRRLSEHRKIVFYDQRGNGRSTRVTPNAPQTLEAQVADLEAVRMALHAKTIDLVGDSFGGLIVLAYTLAHPDHVQHLIVSDGLPGWKAIVHPMPDVFPDLDAQEEAGNKGMPKSEKAEDRAFSIHIRECFYSPEKADQYLANFHDFGLNAPVNQQVSAATQNVDLSPELRNIKVPTLILTGRFDMNVAPITAWRMAHAIPGAQLHIFEHSGHLPSYEEPDDYLKRVVEFLSQ